MTFSETTITFLVWGLKGSKAFYISIVCPCAGSLSSTVSVGLKLNRQVWCHDWTYTTLSWVFYQEPLVSRNSWVAVKLTFSAVNFMSCQQFCQVLIFTTILLISNSSKLFAMVSFSVSRQFMCRDFTVTLLWALLTISSCQRNGLGSLSSNFFSFKIKII